MHKPIPVLLYIQRRIQRRDNLQVFFILKNPSLENELKHITMAEQLSIWEEEMLSD